MGSLAGVDGCPAGWLCVVWTDGAPGPDQVTIFRTAEALLVGVPGARAMGVDVPIGLVSAGVRACDVEARRLLGTRRACVFDAPLRPALDAPSRLAADLITREIDGRGVSTQAWEVSHKVRNMDRAITPQHQAWCVEVHPELSFAAWNGGAPLLTSKKTDEGRLAREALIDARWPGCQARLLAALDGAPRSHWAVDDLNDALAALWTAERFARGTAERIPEEPQVDARGLRCEMWR